jgi:hypothetical protein
MSQCPWAVKANAAFRMNWMRQFESICTRERPTTVGRIKWDEVQFYFNRGDAVEDAARSYLDATPAPAAACPRCHGWTSSGGMSQHAEGAHGCTCNR